MFSIALALVTWSVPPGQVAFSARFYNPSGDKRISKWAVYLSNLDGTKRRRITPLYHSVTILNWESRTKVRFKAAASVADEDREFFIDLRTGKTSGAPQWKPSKEPEDTSPWQKQSVDQRYPGRLKVDLKQNKLVFTGSGAEKTFAYENPIQDIRQDKASNQLWIYSGTHDSTRGSLCWIDAFDWKTNTLQPLVKEVGDYDINPRTPIYVARSPRDVSPYGSIMVWTSNAWAGNWKTGEKWPFATGLVEVHSVAIRPSQR